MYQRNTKGKNYMKIIYRSVVLLSVALFSTGCLYTDIQMPMDKNFDKTELGVKEGESESHTVLYLVSWGDSGTKAAAKDGDVKVIRHADRKVFSILFGLYTKLTTVVYGD